MQRVSMLSIVVLTSVATVIGSPTPASVVAVHSEPAIVERLAEPADTATTVYSWQRGTLDQDEEVQPETPAGAYPLTLFLPGVAAHVIPVGLNPDGSMEIPSSVHEVGWYTLTGVLPGAPGSAVLAGHVNSRIQGRGAFAELAQVQIGEEVRLETDQGVQVWMVTDKYNVARSALPIPEIFTLDGAPRLVLVTCGGEFNEEQRSFEDNVVVYAELVSEIAA